jgi:hypothetical protein
MTIEIPATSDLPAAAIEARIMADPSGRLRVAFGRSKRASYVLAAVLEIGCRIVYSTPDEQALLEAYGMESNQPRALPLISRQSYRLVAGVSRRAPRA